MSYVPPLSVARAAARGLALRAQFGRGGTAVGIARARDLSNRRGVSERTLKRMRSYFARHAVDARAAGWGDAQNPSTGWIAWLLWGGDAGRKWAETHVVRAASCTTIARRMTRNPRVPKEKMYLGEGELPTWVRAGVRVRVKDSAYVRQHGLGFASFVSTDAGKVRPGTVGVIRRVEGPDWYAFHIVFPNRDLVLSPDVLKGVTREVVPRGARKVPQLNTKRNPRAEAAWATIEYVAPGEALLLVKSTNGRGIGGDIVRIHRGSKRELYEQAYALAEAYARRAHLPLARMSQVDT